MKLVKIWCLAVLFISVATVQVSAQVPEDIITESSDPDDIFLDDEDSAPIDDVIEKRLLQERLILAYDYPREHDIFWERRVWRVIDVREKMNQTFVYPEAPFFKVITEAIASGKLRAFDDEQFKVRLSPSELDAVFVKNDTITVPLLDDPDNYELKIISDTVARYTNITQFRVKEVWYFDSEASELRVRILGIAPLYTETIYDEFGNGTEIPPRALFWLYYPDCREAFSRSLAFNPLNDASPLSWDDVFQMRRFSSFIIKSSNVQDFRLVDYPSLKESGVNLLLESEKIKQEIFNFEHDLWSY
ncbi:MAG: gliding motility protein GldN [Saprospiraceae bacterium]|nr:gliding motility protein GldN [Saprospiraceae bacterium]